GADFQKRRTAIQQGIDALAWQQFAPGAMARLGLFAAALGDLRQQGSQFCQLLEHGAAIGGELRRVGVDLGVEYGHFLLPFRLDASITARFAHAGRNFLWERPWPLPRNSWSVGVSGSARTIPDQSTSGGFHWCRRRSHRAWRHAVAGRWGSR